MHELLESLPADQKKKLVPMPEPEWEDTMLATLTHHYFSDPGWVYDRKLDGARCITYWKGNQIRLMSRTRHEMSASFPEIMDALAALSSGNNILDGEIVAFRDGETDFQMLEPLLGVIDPGEALIRSSSSAATPTRTASGPASGRCCWAITTVAS